MEILLDTSVHFHFEILQETTKDFLGLLFSCTQNFPYLKSIFDYVGEWLIGEVSFFLPKQY